MREAWRDLEALIAADPVKGAYLTGRPLIGAGEQLFRMALWRIWDSALPLLSVCCMNPSKADGTREDMTSTKIKGFAERQGYGGYILGNIWAYRATQPSEVMQFGSRSAVGPDNDKWLAAIVEGRDCLAAWGVVNLDPEHQRAVEILIMGRAKRVFCLGVTAGGYPRHPSRIGYDTPWEEWTPERRVGR